MLYEVITLLHPATDGPCGREPRERGGDLAAVHPVAAWIGATSLLVPDRASSYNFV